MQQNKPKSTWWIVEKESTRILANTSFTLRRVSEDVLVAGGIYPGISGKRETSPDRDKERPFQFISMVPDNLQVLPENMDADYQGNIFRFTFSGVCHEQERFIYPQTKYLVFPS